MNDMDIVSAVRTYLAEKLGQQRYELWFGSATNMTFGGKTLVVETAHQFSQDWLRRHYRGALEAAGRAAVGNAVDVEFRLDPRLADKPAANHCQQSARTECSIKTNSLVATAFATAGVATESVESQILPHSACQPVSAAVNLQFAKSMPINQPSNSTANGGSNNPHVTSRRRFATLASFVVGSGNRLAHASAQMVAERPGSLNPFLVYGPPGSGKTHLLEGICTAARNQGRCTNAVYLSAEQFTTFFVEALRGSGLPNFRRKYRAVDVLVVDDLQFLAGKRATLVELLHTIDALLREGRQLVFAADRAPAELVKLGPELTTRLSGGMVCQMELPDAATRFGLAHHFARRLEIELPDDVAQFVAARVTTGAREIGGAIKRLHAAGRMYGRTIDLPAAEESLAELLHSGRKAIRLSDIEAAVCDTFGLPTDSLQSERRSKNVSAPRMLAMWLARRHTRAGLSEIGQYFGRRSHSTVISAQKRVDDWMTQQSEVVVANSPCKVDEALRRVELRLRVG
jgi:chromosomal replication initiator protein